MLLKADYPFQSQGTKEGKKAFLNGLTYYDENIKYKESNSVAGLNESAIDENDVVTLKTIRGLDRDFHEGNFTAADIDWGAIIDLAPAEIRRLMKNCDKGTFNESEALHAYRAAGWDQLLDVCAQETIVDFSCGTAPFGMGGLMRRISRPCSDHGVRDKFCEWSPPPEPESCCEDPDQAARFSTPMPEKKCWQLPPLCQRSFAFALHRDLDCINAREEILGQIGAWVTGWERRREEKESIALIYGITGCTGCGTDGLFHGFHFDNTKYETAYRELHHNAPWVNSITDIDLQMTRCKGDTLICRLESLWEDMIDPTTCEPVSCPGDLKVLLNRKCQDMAWRDILGPHELEQTLSGEPCSPKRRMNRAGRDGWDVNFDYSLWTWECLVNYYLNDFTEEYTDPVTGLGVDAEPASVKQADPVKARALAEYWAFNTYIISKSWQDTFGHFIDFVEQRECTRDDMCFSYLDHGFTLARRYVYKESRGFLKPHLTIRVRGFDPTDASAGGSIV